jgi:hypothetical protein
MGTVATSASFASPLNVVIYHHVLRVATPRKQIFSEQIDRGNDAPVH